MVVLTPSQIEFEPGSVVDPAGKVFHYNSQVFRAIPHEYSQLYRSIIEGEIAKELFSAGLIHTKIAEFGLEEYGLVLEHDKVAYLSSWSEWCSSMIKDAAIATLRLNIELVNSGLVTKDVQPGNMQFVNGRPIWIDFGSIVEMNSHNTFKFNEFRYQTVFPLWLMSKGFTQLGRFIYQEVGMGYFKRKIARKYFRMLPPRYGYIYKTFGNKDLSKALTKILQYVKSLRINPKALKWTDYGQGGSPPINKPELFGKKASQVYKLLIEDPQDTLLDIGCNKGWYSILAESLGYQVAAFDTDDASICKLYNHVNDQQSRILPLVLDFLYPSPPYSIGLGKGSALERLRSDTVLALAIIHHVVFKHGIFFEPVARLLSEYSKRRAIVEFVPSEDQYVREWYNDNFRWYTLENFKSALQQHFREVREYDSWPEPRKLLLCLK